MKYLLKLQLSLEAVCETEKKAPVSPCSSVSVKGPVSGHKRKRDRNPQNVGEPDSTRVVVKRVAVEAFSVGRKNLPPHLLSCPAFRQLPSDVQSFLSAYWTDSLRNHIEVGEFLRSDLADKGIEGTPIAAESDSSCTEGISIG